MLYCPKCGTQVKENETYCIKCGKALPEDMQERINDKKSISRWWALPVVTIILVALTVGLTSYLFQQRDSQAMERYTEAEQLIEEEKYKEANTQLQEALEKRSDFSQAETLLTYTHAATKVEENLAEASASMNEKNYSQALKEISGTAEKLAMFSGDTVSALIEEINQMQATIKLEELRAQFEEGPSFEELRILIWEAEEINLPEAEEIAALIRERIVDYTFSRASEELSNHQFNDALLITEDGLKYAPGSERLQTLLANIQKEQHAFEAEAEERMEQAMNVASSDYQMNENDAIELLDVSLENNDDGQIVIKGEVKSNATVPIQSITIEYALLFDTSEVAENETFVVPDTLYPSETGEFEFTHFELAQNSSDLEIEVKTITWYTN